MTAAVVLDRQVLQVLQGWSHIVSVIRWSHTFTVTDAAHYPCRVANRYPYATDVHAWQ